jgi:hypothetical protein
MPLAALARARMATGEDQAKAIRSFIYHLVENSQQ